jgi:hypothetical protein
VSEASLLKNLTTPHEPDSQPPSVRIERKSFAISWLWSREKVAVPRVGKSAPHSQNLRAGRACEGRFLGRGILRGGSAFDGPAESALANGVKVIVVESTLAKMHEFKSFRMRTYEKVGGGVPLQFGSLDQSACP